MNEIIKNIIIEILKLDEEQAMGLREDTNLIELGLDSLSSVEIVVNLEDKFNIMIDDDELLVENMASIDLLTDLVNKYKED